MKGKRGPRRQALGRPARGLNWPGLPLVIHWPHHLVSQHAHTASACTNAKADEWAASHPGPTGLATASVVLMSLQAVRRASRDQCVIVESCSTCRSVAPCLG